MKKSVYITVPNSDGWIHKNVHFAIMKMFMDGRYKIRHDCPSHKPYVYNLHKCMWDFLNSNEDYWLTIDTDNPPINNPLDLIEFDCDVIGCSTPVWHNAVKGDRPWYFNALDRKEDGYIPHTICDGLQEIDAIGSGCLLIARRVIIALKDKQPFARQWNKHGLVNVGCDYSFCEKAKKEGFKVWTHYDYQCMHFNEIELGEVIRAFGDMVM